MTAKEVGFNEIELLASDTVGFANQTLELLKLKSGNNERAVYVYNRRGLDYYFFSSLNAVLRFFSEGEEPEHRFGSERELDGFLRCWSG